MSYQVLARKWRPSTFDQMVGQEHVLKALVNALDGGRLHHAYLFSGTRGVGKTSIARLFAKALNCEVGVSSKPCGQCSACREIKEGRFIDLIEVDAASRTKVEDTRELLENVQYAPSQGRFKVYLIDEVHMLSSHSFNALLKTLEEPPPHVKFLLATTDPQKLPVTILSRCLQFNLKNMTPERIVEHLREVLKAEQVSFEDAALWHLSRAATGSMRDALSLTDQAISFTGGSITETDVRAMLGSVDSQQILQLLQQLAQGAASELMSQVAAIAEYGADFDDVLAELLGLLHRIAIAQMLPESVDNSLGDQEAVLALAGALKAEDVQLFYQIALNGRKDLPLAPLPRDGFEMTLLRMLAFRPVQAGQVAFPSAASPEASGQTVPSTVTNAADDGVSSVQVEDNPPSVANQKDAVVDRPDESDQGAMAAEPVMAPVMAQRAAAESVESQACLAQFSVAEVELAAALPQADPGQVETVHAEDNAPAPRAEPGFGKSPAFDDTPAFEQPPPFNDPPPWADTAAELSPPDLSPPDIPAKKCDTPESAQNQSSSGGKLEDLAAAPVVRKNQYQGSLNGLDASGWIGLLDTIGLSGMTYNIAANSTVDTVAAGRIDFLLPARQFHLYNDTHQKRIETALSDFFAEPVAVLFREGESETETPAQYKQRRRQERHAEAVSALQGDINVQAIVERFGGVIDLASVQPVDTE